jgi:hypothetical protein
MMNPMRSLAATAAVFTLGGAVVAGSAGAVPKPAPKFWSPARCERAMLARPFSPPSQVTCVGSGGPAACRLTSGHRARLYAEFAVFARYENGVVRSFTLATRARDGFVRKVHHWGDPYAGWPADFYMGPVKLLAIHATPARFRSIVAPIAARVTQEERAADCTGG